MKERNIKIKKLLIDKKSWIPNWKRAERYYYAKSDDPKLVAWQFLRRNKLYNEFFESRKKQYIKLCKKHKIEISDIEFNKKNIFIGYRDKKHTHQKTNCLSQPIEFLPEDDEVEEISTELKRWGLHGYVDPSCLRPKYLMFKSQNQLTINAYEDPDLILSQDVPVGHASVLIDLSRNINTQINSIKPVLKNWKEILNKKNLGHSFKKNNDIYVRYLRLIDGLISGSTPLEIKKEIYKNISFADIDDQYKKDKNQALKNVEKGYKTLLYISS